MVSDVDTPICDQGPHGPQVSGDPDYEAYLDAMPKCDLHVHLTGTVRASTFAELAGRAGLNLPADAKEIYANVNSRFVDPAPYQAAVVPVPRGPAPDEPTQPYSLFKVSEWVWDAIGRPEDLTRVTYEAFQDAHTSNVRHLELFFDEFFSHRFGYPQAVAAMKEGLRSAETDFAMTGGLIAAIDRSRSAADALTVVQRAVDHPCPDVVGVGLDNLETVGPPERFLEAYRLAAKHGLRRTAHSCEHVCGAENAVTCLDELGCNRIDHGYFVLQNDEVVARMVREQVPFTCIFTTSRRSWRPWRRASVRRMLDAGMNMIVCSDDPGLFPTTLATEYRIAAFDVGVDRAGMQAMALAGVEACWLDEDRKVDLRARFHRELAALERRYSPAH